MTDEIFPWHSYSTGTLELLITLQRGSGLRKAGTSKMGQMEP